jgi:hypothetical protein
MNTHNPIISNILACNNNIQIGGMGQLYYNSMYAHKDTQLEDCKKWLTVSASFSRGIVSETVRQRELEASGETTEVQPDFLRGLIRVMNGIRSHMSSTTISATMAHLLSTRGGSRFHFSHETQGLPISQLEDLEAGEELKYYYRRTKKPDSDEFDVWLESFADNYLLRPDELETYCTYSMTMNFEVIRVGVTISERSDTQKSKKYKGEKLNFLEGHPSKKRSHVRELKHIQIPVIYMKQALPEISKLELNSLKPSMNAKQQREYFAKIVLLLFYPFRDFSELKHEDGTFWSKYIWARDNGKLWEYDPKNFQSSQSPNRALAVLQNIQDKVNCHELKRPVDIISETTVEKPCTEKGSSRRKNEDETDMTYEDQIKVLYPDLVDESGGIGSCMTNCDPRNTTTIRSKAPIPNHSLVNPPCSNEKIFLDDNSTIHEDVTDSDTNNTATSQRQHTDIYALIEFIKGAVLYERSVEGESMVRPLLSDCFVGLFDAQNDGSFRCLI